jgi:general nucleoside transport system permease protein
VDATLASIVAAAAPLVYVTIGETMAERSGVVNLSLEGSIMLSALAAFAAAFVTGSVVLGVLAAMAVGAFIASIIAYASIQLRLNQIAVGFVLTLLAIHLSSLLGNSYVGVRGPRVPSLPVPGLADLPFLGKVLFQQNLSVYGSYIVIIVAYVFIFMTRPGLELQGIGERPEAAYARGVPVNRLRYVYTILGGALAGVAGAAFSLDVIAGWRLGLTRNFGWIALAIVIFGAWHPVRVALGAYLFGVLQIFALKQQSRFPGLAQILPLMPFALMIFALVLVYLNWFRRIGERVPALRRFLSSDPPSALGTSFQPE